jgi:hypothetical protein
MKLTTLPLLALTTFFISCGDNTTTSPIAEVESIKINESNISLYATDVDIPLTANIYYTDNTNSSITPKVSWISSDIYQLSTSVNSSTANITSQTNGGDVNLKIIYRSSFEDTQSVHIKELISLNYSDINISDIGTPQTLYVTGNFENNESNVSLLGNLSWSMDSNATVTESNASQITFTIDSAVTSLFVEGKLFADTDREVDFNNTFY